MTNLNGLRVAVTRPAAQSDELAGLLRRQGAAVIECPLIRVVPRALDDAARRLLHDLAGFDWVVLTSVNGVAQLARALEGIDIDKRAVRVACVGPVTAAAARQYGFEPVAVPSVFTGAALPSAMSIVGSLTGKRILLARASGAGTALPALLGEAGATVTELELYQSILDPDGAAVLGTALDGREVDLLTFTSGSAVANFVQAVGSGRAEAVRVAAIGPSTAHVAESHGLRVDILATTQTTAGLVEAIVNFYGTYAADGG